MQEPVTQIYSQVDTNAATDYAKFVVFLFADNRFESLQCKMIFYPLV